MLIYLAIETTNEDSVAEAAEFLADLPKRSPRDLTRRADPNAALDAAVGEVVKLNLDDDSPRLSYLFALADAGDAGADLQSLVDEWFAGKAQRYGGTRGAIQRAWLRGGGDRFGAELIRDLPDGRQVMLAVARESVRERAFHALGEATRQKLVRRQAATRDGAGE